MFFDYFREIDTNVNVIIKVTEMSQRFSHLSSIVRVFLTYIALMVIQNVEGANILSKYKSGYNVDKVCF